jgi:hypothetical protein
LIPRLLLGGGGGGAGFSVSLPALAVGGAPCVCLSIRVWPGLSCRCRATLLLPSNRSHPAPSCVQTPTSVPLIGLGFGTGNISAMRKSLKELRKHLVKYYHCVLVTIYMLLCLWADSMLIRLQFLILRRIPLRSVPLKFADCTWINPASKTSTESCTGPLLCKCPPAIQRIF